MMNAKMVQNKMYESAKSVRPIQQDNAHRAVPAQDANLTVKSNEVEPWMPHHRR